jgi:ethanolamine utilization protein EutN
MIIGNVVGTVIATRKNERLTGSKFMIVEYMQKIHSTSERIVAVDNVGAGVGDIVLVATGSAARLGAELKDSPIDAMIVGIVDDASKIVI